jgi:hypothetical protein
MADPIAFRLHSLGDDARLSFFVAKLNRREEGGKAPVERDRMRYKMRDTRAYP